MLHTYTILRTSLRVVYYTTNVFTRSICTCKYYINLCLAPLLAQPIAACPTHRTSDCSTTISPFLRAHLFTCPLSLAATMEEKIPPWKDRRRNSTVNWSNEIDRWVNWRRDRRKKRMDTYAYMLHTYTILRTSLRVVYYTTNVFTA